MRQVSRLMAKAIDSLGVLQVRLAASAILAMIGVILWAVFTRYVLRNPIRYSVELPSLLMLLLIPLALAYTQREKGHVAVTMVTERLPARLKNVLQIPIGILFLVYIAFVTWGIWSRVWIYFTAGVRSHEARIPMSVIGVLVIAGVVTLALQVLVEIARAIAGVGRHSRPGPRE